jgi:alpha-L-fucosidase
MTRPLPHWYDDAKFGIFIHWGIFAIPAFAPAGTSIADLMRTSYDDVQAHVPYVEWYENACRLPGSPSARHHAEVWGNRPYTDFRPMFDEAASAMDPAAWAKLFADAGAKYAVFVSKHHDGYVLWPSAVENPHRPGWASARDFTGELADAVRAAGLRWGAYYSGGLDWTFRPSPIANMGEMFAGVPTDEAYRAYAGAQIRELIARTKPSVLWNDIAWPDQAEASAVMADYYGAVPDGVVNDRWLGARNWFESMRESATRDAFNARVKEALAKGGGMDTPDLGFGDFRTTEYSENMDHTRKWEACRGVGHSFGYNAQETADTYMTGVDVVRLLVKTVAHGGNLLLNVGPKADGSIPEEQARPLRETGAWLAVNGAAIYATRGGPLHGRTAEGAPFVTTQRDGRVFVILTEGAKPGPVTIPALSIATRLERTGEMPHVLFPG